MKRARLAAWAVLLLARSAGAQAPLQVEHVAPSCFVAEKPAVLIACLTPRSARADVRVLFHADDGPWYATTLRHEMPCYRGVLPRPSAGTPSVSYVVEAVRGGVTARSAEHQVPVADACAGAAPIATSQRATWDPPAGAPRTPPGFEGSRLRDGTASQRSTDAPSSPPTPAPRPEAQPRAPSAVATPRPPAPRPAAAQPPPAARKAKGGHGVRNAIIVLGGVAAAGGGAVAIRGSGTDGDGGPPTTTGTGLPSGGVSGTYVGVETVVYSGTCTGTDDVVLNLQQSASALSGVLSFTVRTCPCCAAGRGATPISGFLSDTRIEFSTPIGFGYSGSFAGNRVSGSLSGPNGVTGTWTVDKR